jgi:hypothetical protein
MGDMNIYNPKAKIQIFQNFSHAEQTQMREAMLAVVAALRAQIPAGANREAFEKPLAELETEARAKIPAGEKVGKLLEKVGNMFEAVGKPIGKIAGALKGATELAGWLGQHWPF